MASLLLSMLLVCAVLIMTIGQIGSISESYQQAIARIGFGAGQDIARLVQIAGMTEGPAGHGIAAEDMGSSSPAIESTQLLTAQFHSARFGRKSGAAAADASGNSYTPLALDFGKGNFDRDAARQAAALAAQDKQLLAQVDLSKVDIRKIKFNNLDFSGVTFHRSLTPQQMAKIDFSGVDFGNLTPDRVKKIKPLLAKEAVLYQLELQKARPKALPTPVPIPAPALPAPVPVPSAPALVYHYRIVFTEETTDLNRAQKQLFLSWAENIKASSDPVRVWTEVPSGDDFLQSGAFARLALLRTWLIDAGVPAERVRIALQNSGNAPLRELTVHIELQKR
jgi:hypothetical protein